MAQPFPFAAIVAQEDMKKALLMAAVEPLLGGVLIFGDRGTGKSTAVRALTELLPPIETREGCRYNCLPAEPQSACTICNPTSGLKPPAIVKHRAPMIDLPLGATEDRVCGSLDIEKALVAGEKHFEPGLLAAANRGFLYIDEINLLEDHLVDLLLDAAASGVNVVEREGLSIRHAARFVLVGSGNPEEGDLRPQLLDRFGLAVDVRTIDDLAARGIDAQPQVIELRDHAHAITDHLLTGFPIGSVLGLYAATHRAMIAAVTPIAIPPADARALVAAGWQVIAPSRFGYLGSDFPADAGPDAQADALAALQRGLDRDVEMVGDLRDARPFERVSRVEHPEERFG